MTAQADRLLFPLQQWGALRWAPLLFLALLLSTAGAGAQSVEAETSAGNSRGAVPDCAGAGTDALASADLLLARRDGGHELLLIDARTLDTRGRCRLPQALQGAPLRSPDGRHVYAATSEGWVLRLDLQDLRAVLTTRTGARLSGLALSGDGRWLLAGHTRPHSLVLLDAALQPVRTFPTTTLAGGASSAVAGVWHAAARQSFVVAFDTLPELWELSYSPGAAPIYDGLVHDYRMGEAIATAGFLGPRRTPLPAPQRVLLSDEAHRHLLLTAAPHGPAPAATQDEEVEILNLDIRRGITTRRLPGRPLAGAGAAYKSGARAWLAVPIEPEGRVVLLEAGTWQLRAEALASVRGVLSVRTHPAVTQLWLLASTDAPADTLVLVDKRNERVIATLREAGRSWTEVSFGAAGLEAVLATRGPQGEIRRLDTRTLRELGRVALADIEALFALDGPRAAPARP